MKNKITYYDINENKVTAFYSILEQVTITGIKKIEFRTYLSNDADDDWFDFKVALLENNTLKVTDMFISKESHRKKGIPEALILEVKRIYNKQVISSSNKKPKILGEWRRDEASKAWERLVSQGKAKYDEEEDIYVLT